MKCAIRLVAAMLVFGAAGFSLAQAPQDEVKIDRKHLRELKAKFVTYGFNPKQSLIQEGTNLHIKLPAGVANIGQTGVSSKFVLAGECDASCSYNLINFPPVKTGYGSSIGLVFDAPAENSWGGIQRAYHPQMGNCFLIMTVLPDSSGKMKEQFKALPTKTTKGKLGLRREKSDLVFLAADSPTGELTEVHRFPFTDETIRGVRFFADPGGSPTALEARLGDMSIRAEEITGGIPKREEEGFPWHWLAVGLVVLIVAGFLTYRLKMKAK